MAEWPPFLFHLIRDGLDEIVVNSWPPVFRVLSARVGSIDPNGITLISKEIPWQASQSTTSASKSNSSFPVDEPDYPADLFNLLPDTMLEVPVVCDDGNLGQKQPSLLVRHSLNRGD